jgi:hypothetical protein
MLALVAMLGLSGCTDNAPAKPTVNVLPTTPLQQPTQSPLAGWQTYQDSMYLFAIQYPPQWSALATPHPSTTPPYEEVDYFPQASGPTPPTLNLVSLIVAQTTPNSPDSSVPQGFTPVGMVLVSGQEELLYTGPDPAGGQDFVVQFAQNGELFLFSARATTANADALKQTFTQMLSTFQLG